MITWPAILLEPALVRGLVEFLDALELVISLRIIFVGRSDLVRDDRHSALFQHLHQHGCARARQAGDQNDRPTVANATIQRFHSDALCSVLRLAISLRTGICPQRVDGAHSVFVAAFVASLARCVAGLAGVPPPTYPKARSRRNSSELKLLRHRLIAGKLRRARPCFPRSPKFRSAL